MKSFYLKADIEGRESPLTGGPRRKEAPMETILYQRDKGESIPVFRLYSFTHKDPDTGKLILTTKVFHCQEEKVLAVYTTEY